MKCLFSPPNFPPIFIYLSNITKYNAPLLIPWVFFIAAKPPKNFDVFSTNKIPPTIPGTLPPPIFVPEEGYRKGRGIVYEVSAKFPSSQLISISSILFIQTDHFFQFVFPLSN